MQPPDTEPCLYVRHFEGSDCAIFYANGAEGDGPAEIEAGLVRAMERLGHKVTEIIDITPMPHNGCRPPKKRRV